MATNSVHITIPADAPEFADQVVHAFQSTFGPQGSINTAVATLDDLLLKESQASGQAASFLWWFWDLVHDIASQVPSASHEQDQLIAIVDGLLKLPSKKMKLGDDWGTGSEANVWVDLPMFATTFREKLDESSATEHATQRLNLESYAARVAGIAHLPFEMYAIWALVDALEGTMMPVRGSPDVINEDPTAIEDFSTKLNIASIWMVNLSKQMHGRDEVVHGATAGPLWKLATKDARIAQRRFKGTDGLCPDRWSLWKERFILIRDSEKVDSETRKQAGSAVEAMLAAETSAS